MKKLLILPVVLALCGANAASAQMPPPPPRMVTVTGEASEDIAPDRATLSLMLTSENPDLNEAKKDNDAMVERLVVIARDFKIPKEKIKTNQLSIRPVYEYDKPTSRNVFRHYSIQRYVTIVMDDLSIHERVLSAIVEAKIKQVNSVDFSVASPQTVAAGLRVRAMADAKAKAEALAQAAGARLGPALNISAASYYQPWMRGKFNDGMARLAAAAPAPESVAPSLPGMVTLRESVTASFALE